MGNDDGRHKYEQVQVINQAQTSLNELASVLQKKNPRLERVEAVKDQIGQSLQVATTY